ncbi:ribonuclease H-like domain-containing protein [Tanacetum coccineum]
MSQPANDDFSQHISDDEASYHENASKNGTATNKPKQQLIPTTTTISNIKLPILKKEEYDIWAMEMEHYLEYIDNDVWKVIQNGNSKKRISTGKDGVVRILPPVSAAEIHAKIQKAVLKQQFEAFTISSSEGLEKGYDRFQQLLSQLEAHGAEVSTEDANHKFLRSLPPAWSNLAMTMRTKPDVDTLSIDDLYNNLRVFEQELTSTSKSSASAQNVAFVSHSKSSTNKVKSGHTGAYSTYTPTSSNNIQEREVPAGFADEVIYSLFAKQSEDLDLLHEDLEQIDDVDIEEMDINWQIAMIAIRMKKFYKKTGRRVRIDGNKPVGFDKKKLECFKCHNTGHFARECPSKGTNDGKKRDSFYQDQGAGKKEQNQNCLLTMDDGVVNWGEHTVEEEETNHALMAISSNTEVSLCSKTCIDSYNKLKTLCDEQMNQLGEQEAKILAYTLAVKKLEAQIENRNESCKRKGTIVEIHAVEKERKARTILLMAIPKEHLRRFHGMDDAKEIWEAIRTRFGGNANSKKMQKAVLKQQFEAFSISSSEGLEKGYDRFQQLLSQLEAHGAEVSTEDANHKFLRSLPPAWSNLAMTMRTKPDVDTLSIDDLYNNLRVFEQELTSTSKSSASAQNVAFVSHSKSSTNKVKSGHTGAYSTYTPSTSSNNIPEREVPAGFADEVIS